ncbi:transcription antitermination factor NusB [Marinilabiliaceae bacterium ANBcel2]|nr:transcription antitermination factor NusB [Marinilabiliaceae bacterium ANBcel2]
MLSRRLLRVKVMQSMYAYYHKEDVSLQKVEKELFHSIYKSYELYHLLLLLIVEIHAFAVDRIDRGKTKKRPSLADLNPNRRFIDNVVLNQLASNSSLLKFKSATGISWVNNPELIRSLYSKILESDLYNRYMESGESDYNSQKRFVVKLVEKVIGQYEDLYNQLEEQSIFWNDESEFIVSMVIKTIKEFEEERGDEQILQKEFKDSDDKNFVTALFRKAVINRKEFLDLIENNIQNWDLDRIALMDIILMQMAMGEMTEFTEIPVKVTLNEYIELAKHYSTPRSATFINGLLDKIVNDFKGDERIVKQGRGLIN